MERELGAAILIFFKMRMAVALKQVIDFLNVLIFFEELLHVPFYIADFLQPRLKHLRIIRFVL